MLQSSVALKFIQYVAPEAFEVPHLDDKTGATASNLDMGSVDFASTRYLINNDILKCKLSLKTILKGRDSVR